MKSIHIIYDETNRLFAKKVYINLSSEEFELLCKPTDWVKSSYEHNAPSEVLWLRYWHGAPCTIEVLRTTQSFWDSLPTVKGELDLQETAETEQMSVYDICIPINLEDIVDKTYPKGIKYVLEYKTSGSPSCWTDWYEDSREDSREFIDMVNNFLNEEEEYLRINGDAGYKYRLYIKI